MDRQTQQTVSPVACLRGWGVSARLDVLLCLFALAVQLFIPAAQVWHLAAEHITAASPPQLLDLSGQLSTLRVKLDIPQRHDSYDLAECPVCQAFVHVSDAVETPSRLSVDLAACRDDLFLRGPPLRQTPLNAATPRAPPVLS
jgi:hypothetical protein